MLIQLEFAYDEGLGIVVSAGLFTLAPLFPGQAQICPFFFSFLTKSIGWNGVAFEEALDKALTSNVLINRGWSLFWIETMDLD